MMKKILIICFFFNLLQLSSIAGEEVPHQKAIEDSRKLIKSFLERNRIPGISVSVSVKGQIVWSEGFGFADLEQRIPVKSSATKFRIGSVSKPITAAALGRLFESGKMDFDAPVQKYVPGFPEKKYPVTIRQITGHTAGIRHYRGEEYLSAKQYKTVKEGLEIFAGDTLLFQPGTKYSYSSYGWNLVSAAVEGASGKDFLSYMQQYVFDELGMINTTPDFTDSIIPHRTRYYQLDSKGKLINAPFVDNSYKWAGGGFLATTDDLVKFGDAHIKPGFLSEGTLGQLLTSQKTADGKETHYGMGWKTMEDGFGNHIFGHSGGSVGGITQLIVYPDQEIVVAVLTNSSNVSYGDVHFRIANWFAGQTAEMTDQSAALNDFIGEYQFEAGPNAKVSIYENQPVLEIRNAQYGLIPVDKHEFKTYDGQVVKFEKEKKNYYLYLQRSKGPLKGVKL